MLVITKSHVLFRLKKSQPLYYPRVGKKDSISRTTAQWAKTWKKLLRFSRVSACIVYFEQSTVIFFQYIFLELKQFSIEFFSNKTWIFLVFFKFNQLYFSFHLHSTNYESF